MLENYVDDIVGIITTNKAAIGITNVFDEVDWENNHQRESTGYPVCMVDAIREISSSESSMDIQMEVQIWLLFNIESQTPPIYNAARAAAWEAAKKIRKTYLRNISAGSSVSGKGWEEPDTVEIEGSLVILQDRKVYGILMTVTTTSPITE